MVNDAVETESTALPVPHALTLPLAPEAGVRGFDGRTVKAVAVVTAVRTGPGRKRPGARVAVLVFALVFLGLNVGLSVGMDRVAPGVRDPEYGRRLSRLRARQAERPAAKTLLVLGSSRAAMGVRPEFFNDPAGPVAVNFAQVGSGPTMNVMTLRRLLADGALPDAVLLEFWPPFLRGDGPYREQLRIDPHRLLPQDRGFIRDYFDDPAHTFAVMADLRQFPVTAHRRRLMSQIQPGWLAFDKRMDAAWQKMDRWGWLPGLDADPPADERRQRHDLVKAYYGPLFADFAVAPQQERATRELLSALRGRGVPVGLVWLPESSEFRGWYTPAAVRDGDAFLARVRADFGLPLIDARLWADDAGVADGFHMTQPAAAAVSRRLAPELKAVFPTLWGPP